MRLSKNNEKLLVELVKNKDGLEKYLEDLYKGLTSSEESKMNARFGTLEDEGFLQVYFADDRAYDVFLKPEADDYVEDNGLLVEEFTKYTFIDLLRAVGSKHGNINPKIWNITGRSRSIEWKKIDELEWIVRIGVVSNITEVKQIGREIIAEMETHNYVAESVDNDDSRQRCEQTIKFVHKSIYQVVPEALIAQDFDFNSFFSDLKNTCLNLQSYKLVSDIEVLEDYKTQYVWRSLKDKGYDVQDQSQRGSSATGKRSGEVDILVNNKMMMPATMIEALKLYSIDSDNIKLHIDKLTNYDTAGLPTNIFLVYTYTADFGDFIRRYMKHINEEAELKYPLLNLKDISSDEHSEFRVLTSTYERSGKKRELLHVFVNLPKTQEEVTEEKGYGK